MSKEQESTALSEEEKVEDSSLNSIDSFLITLPSLISKEDFQKKLQTYN